MNSRTQGGEHALPKGGIGGGGSKHRLQPVAQTFEMTPVPVAMQCLWFDGSPLPIARPQNAAGQAGQDLYRGGAPIFVTTKSEDVAKLAGARDGDASMFLRRLKVYNFTAKVSAPAGRVPDCPHCFAKLVCSHAV